VDADQGAEPAERRANGGLCQAADPIWAGAGGSPLILQRHFVMRRVWPLCEGEGADLGPDIKIIPRVFRLVSETSGMPLIDVTFDGTVGRRFFVALLRCCQMLWPKRSTARRTPGPGRRDRVTWRSGSGRSRSWMWVTLMS
jgi:hypothetical protein